jgi:glucose-6-phosphate 1-dehydrogenase
MICDLLIVGGEGDLAFRKLYPALYHLDKSGSLSDCMKVVGVSRNPHTNDEFRERLKASLRKFVGDKLDEQICERFCQRVTYHSVDATNPQDLETLNSHEFEDPDRDLIVYLATPPSIFKPVCESLQAVGLVRPNTRIVVEKPLGHSRDSFVMINNSLTSIFDESQVYRIDHYLGKETVQNLLVTRFANSLFEPLWSNKFIDHVQITVAETVGIEGRWDFYDEAGALRDMMQNHLMQLLCLAAMEPPARFDAAAVHDEKLKVLNCLKVIDRNSVLKKTVRGQYSSGAVAGEAVPGYRQEEGANTESRTETFVAIKAEIDNWRWARVPFYLRTGKRLGARYSEIVIQFRDVPHAIFPDQLVLNSPNKLVIKVQPDDGISLQLLNKVPGLDESMPLETVTLQLALSEAVTNKRVPDAYERLLFDVMRSNQTLFMRADELEVAWNWVDQIVAGWKDTGQKPMAYTAGSFGPAESVSLIAKDGRNWHEIQV